ncbi:MAG: hypothetical protein DMF63_10185 [Acidobacteria bacterium]|nr:MAG: hypothetical protein DMF63_10185 [Acidobacteriota bacterium]
MTLKAIGLKQQSRNGLVSSASTEIHASSCDFELEKADRVLPQETRSAFVLNDNCNEGGYPFRGLS